MAFANRRAGFRLYRTHSCGLVLLAAGTVLLSGCGNFFSCEGKASCPTTCVASSTVTCPPTGGSGTGTGSGTGSGSSVDYVYIANSATAATSLDGYNVSSGALTVATDAPFPLTYVPTSAVITPSDSFMYIASDAALNTANPGEGFIFGYSIGTGGALTTLGGGDPQVDENDSALAISPDGQWLFTLPDVALTINEYPINASTGALGQLASDYPLSSAPTGTITPVSLAVAPSGEYFAAALATGGANVYPFDTTTGTLPTGQSGVVINPGNSASGIYALAFDNNNFLYCVGTAGLQVFSVTSGATVTLVKTYPVGNGPRSIVINSDSTYLYVGNDTDSTISGYSIGTNAALTALAGSPYAAPSSVDALAIDSTGKYVIASGYNASSGIQLYTIGSAGALTPTASAGDGTAGVPSAIAATH
jgi:6-phosphogluconolactonase